MRRKPDPESMTLAEYLACFGTRTGTFTFNGVRYTDLSEIEWRQANSDWITPRPTESQSG
jgi:hypothetical protein